MARRPLIALFAAFMLSAFPQASNAQALESGDSFDTASSVEADLVVDAPPPTLSYAPRVDKWSAPAAHNALALSFAGLQALDVATTLRGISQGRASEANPMMGGLVRHPAALVGVKAGLTAATVLSMRGLSKSHPKASMLTMIALNAGSALVVRSNLRFVVSR